MGCVQSKPAEAAFNADNSSSCKAIDSNTSNANADSVKDEQAPKRRILTNAELDEIAEEVERRNAIWVPFGYVKTVMGIYAYRAIGERNWDLGSIVMMLKYEKTHGIVDVAKQERMAALKKHIERLAAERKKCEHNKEDEEDWVVI